jgi:DNA replication protein DnaC
MDDETTVEFDYLLRSTPARFREATLDNFDAYTPALKSAVSQARAWRDETLAKPERPSRGLILPGPVGIGKTHIAYAVALDLARFGRSVAAISVPSHFARVRAGIGAGERIPTADALTSNYFGRPWTAMLLDDIGVEKPTDWLREQMYLLVDACYLRNIALIVTSNLSIEELGSDNSLGERIVSRIVALTTPVPFTGDDYRIREARGGRA